MINTSTDSQPKQQLHMLTARKIKKDRYCINSSFLLKYKEQKIQRTNKNKIHAIFTSSKN
jgi:hypothetical protein